MSGRHVHCAWKSPNIAWSKKRLHDTDLAKRYHVTDYCCFTTILQFYYAENTLQLSFALRIMETNQQQ